MAKKKKTGLWIGLSILILGVLYLAYYLFLSPKARMLRLQRKQKDGTITEEEEGELKKLVQSQYSPEDFPLEEGMRGTKVKELQKKLNSSAKCRAKFVGKTCKTGRPAIDIPVFPLDEDGKFGPCTKIALHECQGIFALSSTDYFQMMNPYIAPHTSTSLSWV